MYTNGSVSIGGDINFRDGFARGDVSELEIFRYTRYRLEYSWLFGEISSCTCGPACLSAALCYLCSSHG